MFTTTLATTLLAADRFEWRATGVVFRVANRFPASVAFVVQLLAAFFGVIHVAVISKLINYALRLRITKASVSLDVLRTWVDLSIPRVDWDLPLRFFFPVLFTVFLSLVPPALWAGSITPLIDSTTTNGMLLLPSYEDVSLIREYPMEIGKAGPSSRNQKGFFTYSVGQQLIGPLLSSAAGASSNTSKILLHPKLDNTQFSYRGRSYGVGSSVGLMDMTISQNAQAAGYIYQEEGYMTNVSCIYNNTSNFTLSGPVNEWIYAASGYLPDSVEGPEYSNYIGHDENAIVAIGVSYSERSPRRYLAIAAGRSYAALDRVQCTLDFLPTLFTVSVDLVNRNISVRPAYPIPDFNPHRNLTRTVARQFALLSNDLTTLYLSLLGDAFNASIAAHRMSRPSFSAARNPIPADQATLAGLANSLTAMADAMLAAYASAQLVVGRCFAPHPATVVLYALQFGQPAYVYAVFALNLLVVLAVVGEAVRTRAWAELARFNYLDPRDLVVAASRGGTGVAERADEMVREGGRGKGRRGRRHVWLLSEPDEGNGGLVVRVAGDEGGHAAITVDGDGGDDEGLEDSDVSGEKGAAKRAWEKREARRMRRRLGIFGSTG